MSTLIVIPARYASTRYPGKPLVELRGATGVAKSLIRRSWDAAMKVQGVDRVVVATDDDRIKDAAQAFGAEVVMTSSAARNGTERCAEVIAQLGDGFDIVANLQGDAPLTPPWFVEKLVEGLQSAPTAHVATPILRCSTDALASFKEDRKNDRVGGTTVVFDKNKRALYFSKEVIPFAPTLDVPVYHHVGVYAYRPASLRDYAALPEGPLEKLEGLEQLRFMENGLTVQCVEVENPGQEFWELNNPEDVPRVEKILVHLGLE
ncbi:manno-octulosonate cytidylyltransferase [Roseobacter sp. N2S]|uniref:3-deoxy-manno-octulosonate cytidylyltransferase n=1 Tax=Roseobacter sp. N2S TaxID=2663844 RepID=UPI0028654831|nr:manno-octulosonate cytidylyltransferase [Roseobacter sp. N2S]MDR6263293.1 3-deoxy-manno-octulosonate cytidylyltransferase (CMP-KDO synthetase) [Roseobacter sp. N2S]